MKLLGLNFHRLLRKTTPIEKVLGYTFRNEQLLIQALTHRSAAANGKSYERLEFLGDAIIGLLVAEYLFNKYRDKDEGDLTALRAELVRGTTLAQFGKKLALEQFVQIDKSVNLRDRATMQRILASTVESLVGAIYLDGGLEPARTLVARLVREFQVTRHEVANTNYKGRLFEYCQKSGKPLPVFKLLKTFGPDHAKTYQLAVFVDGKRLGFGSAPQKRAAEQKAAKEALQKLLQK